MIRVGEAVILHHRSDGRSITAGKKATSKVTATYIDGSVRVTSGDTWKVKRINGVLNTCL